MSDTDSSLKTYDPLGLARELLEDRFRKQLTTAWAGAMAMRRAGATETQAAMAMLLVLPTRLAELRKPVTVTAVELWRDQIVWEHVSPSGEAEGPEGRNALTRLLEEAGKIDFCDLDVPALMEFREQELLLQAVYWTAFEFVTVRDDERMDAAAEAIGLIGSMIGRPDYVEVPALSA